MEAYVHSIESMGLVDGPGIRVVVFLQGCALRCRYCHNPDSWALHEGVRYTAKALVEKLSRFPTYFAASGGGVTFSGGEPLLQGEFLADCLRLCKERGIHTCLDTAGVGAGNYDEILKYTDLVLFDVKHYEPEAYHALCGADMAESLRFIEAVRRAGVPMWLRHVLVPNLTDSKEHLEGLAAYMARLPNVEKIELLPYHRLGEAKYEVMGMEYSLSGTADMDKQVAENCQDFVRWCYYAQSHHRTASALLGCFSQRRFVPW